MNEILEGMKKRAEDSRATEYDYSSGDVLRLIEALENDEKWFTQIESNPTQISSVQDVFEARLQRDSILRKGGQP